MAFSFFPMALFHVNVNHVRSISDLDNCEATLVHRHEGKKKKKEPKSRVKLLAK